LNIASEANDASDMIENLTTALASACFDVTLNLNPS
jgi:hypothetical protein